jgi:hypothetical protein
MMEKITVRQRQDHNDMRMYSLEQQQQQQQQPTSFTVNMLKLLFTVQ